MTEKEFEECEQAERQKHDEKLKDLETENAKLKELIEKMKGCHNCRKFHNLSYDCTCAKVCNEWELREIKEDE